MKHPELEKKLNYAFSDAGLIQEALRHRSFVNENPELQLNNNERLEFLGDAVLNLVIGHILLQRSPHLPEGDLSRMRAALVNETQLADIARGFNLGGYIKLGKGEMQTEGRNKNSILADTFEAVIAAVYLDGGFNEAFEFIERHFADPITGLESPESFQDYKSHLQIIVQAAHRETPTYQLIREEGPDHDKLFVVRTTVKDISAEGVGRSKKAAEQDAARKLLEFII